MHLVDLKLETVNCECSISCLLNHASSSLRRPADRGRLILIVRMTLHDMLRLHRRRQPRMARAAMLPRRHRTRPLPLRTLPPTPRKSNTGVRQPCDTVQHPARPRGTVGSQEQQQQRAVGEAGQGGKKEERTRTIRCCFTTAVTASAMLSARNGTA